MARKKTTSKKKVTTRRRKSVKRSKGMLSELFNPVMAQAGGKAILSGAVGGASAGLLNKMLPDTMDPKMKAGYTIAGGFITATMLKMPNVGAGMAGVGMYNLLTTSGFLAEGVEYADDIEALPMVLNENGTAFLQEGYLQDGYLQESDLAVGYFQPDFGM